ncbi:hypothetical protein J2R87_005862 [Bradyrhizobium elkanii]|nr:hypothetical protein [Bradyrhizobium elkanii]MCS4106368.1 hypothetical protein [Bradyrhizobium elkanii]
MSWHRMPLWRANGAGDAQHCCTRCDADNTLAAGLAVAVFCQGQKQHADRFHATGRQN